MNRLMVLGSMDEFIMLVQMAKERGLYTIVCDGYENGPAKKFADKVYHVPVTEIDRIAAICKEEKVDGIITSFSDLLFECMVKIAAKADLKCYFTPEKLPYYRDKSVMKKMFEELSVPSSRYTCLNKDFSDKELDGFQFPVVVKPIDKYGSRGIYVLNSTEEVRSYFDESCATSDIKQILVEEYHDGYEFNMMTWVLDGKVQVISIADREKTPISAHDIPISSRNVYPSRLYDHVVVEATEILQKIADYTGQKDGCLSMQFFWKKESGISVCEVAGRFLGYEHELIELASGFCLEELLLNYVYDEEALRNQLAAHDSRMKRCCAVLYFHGKEAVIADQSKAEELAKRNDVVFDQIFYKDGEKVVQHGPNPYVVRYYVAGESREQVDASTSEIFEAMTIKDVDGNEVLYSDKMTEYRD